MGPLHRKRRKDVLNFCFWNWEWLTQLSESKGSSSSPPPSFIRKAAAVLQPHPGKWGKGHFKTLQLSSCLFNFLFLVKGQVELPHGRKKTEKANWHSAGQWGQLGWRFPGIPHSWSVLPFGASCFAPCCEGFPGWLLYAAPLELPWHLWA